MAEWSIAPDCKSGDRKVYEGSNPSPCTSAKIAQLAERIHGKDEVTGPTPVLGSDYCLRLKVVLRSQTRKVIWPKKENTSNHFIGSAPHAVIRTVYHNAIKLILKKKNLKAERDFAPIVASKDLTLFLQK